MKEVKKSIGLRISNAMHDKLQEKSAETGRSVNGIIEDAINKYLSQEEDTEVIADAVLERIDKKYGNIFTRIRLAAGTADRNIQALLHIKNTELFKAKIDPDSFVSTSEMQHGIIDAAQDEVKRQVALYKQRKDNK